MSMFLQTKYLDLDYELCDESIYAEVEKSVLDTDKKKSISGYWHLS